MAVQIWTGVVMEKKQLASDVIHLSLAVPPEFSFQAGQFITLKLAKDGLVKPKSYSILSSPSQQGKLDFCIKLIPGGYASELFVKMAVGETVLLVGPLGHFVFDVEAEEHWFIGAGTGIAPLYSMIREYLPRFPGKTFRLIFGSKTKKETLFHEEFLALERQYPHFSYLLTLSREKWERMGHVQQHLGVDLQGKTFYICGLKELVLETRAYLEKQGVDPRKIRFERYT